MRSEQYQHTWRDYYEILQVHPKAQSEVITAAYRRLAQIYHPDVNHEPDANERLKLLNEAREVLGDPARRAEYDRVYEEQNAAGRQSARSPGTSSDDSNQQQQAEPGRAWYQDEGEEAWYEEASEDQPTDTDAADQSMWGRARGLVTPRPGEGRGVLPWPSLRVQTWLLRGAIFIGGIMFVAGLANGVVGIVPAILGLLIAGGAVWAGIATKWLRQCEQAPRRARVAAGTSIVISGVAFTAALIYAVLFVLFVVFLAIVAKAVLGEMFS